MEKTLSFIPLGGIEDITRNLYVYEYGNEILLVDCGIGFADETMLGVDLLLPDISYLLKSKKKIVGIALTHGHEDHIGALPFILPQLPQGISLFASPFTAALANEKLKEFGVASRVKAIPFVDNAKISLGQFAIQFIHVTHSVPDTSHILVHTPIGTFYHGSDFKFDLTPYDEKKPDFSAMEQAGNAGILCLLSDCLGAEKEGTTPTEATIPAHFEEELQNTKGKFIVTTYSSHIARLNQVIDLAQKYNRHICFIGRSLIKTKDVAQKMGYMKIPAGVEVQMDELKNYADNQLLLLVAGSQGQENSAMSRIANGEHRDIILHPADTIIFSSDTIPGNEVLVNSLIDSLAKLDVRVVYSDLRKGFHISGHGYSEDLKKLISLTKPKKLIPIGGAYRHMTAYRGLAEKEGYKKQDVLLLEDGQEVIFTPTDARLGRKIATKNVFVDEITGEELEHYVMRDRQKLSEGGIVVVLIEIDAATGRVINQPDIITRGFSFTDTKKFSGKLLREINSRLKNRSGRVKDWVYMRNLVGEIADRLVFKEIRRRPLVLPVVIEI